MLSLFILLTAQMKPDLLCLAMKTYPNLPAPNLRPSLKSSILMNGSSTYLGVFTFENEPAVEMLSLYYFFLFRNTN